MGASVNERASYYYLRLDIPPKGSLIKILMTNVVERMQNLRLGCSVGGGAGGLGVMVLFGSPRVAFNFINCL